MNAQEPALRMGLIYLIRNNINGKGYVGQSVLSLSKRWSLHKSAARRNDAFAICRALRKYGEENFTMDVIKTAPPEQLDDLEKHYIQVYNTHVDNGRGYNCTAGGRGSIGGFSKETRDKMSVIQKELWASQEKRIEWGEYMKEIHAANPELAIKQRETRLRFLADHPEVMIKHSEDMVQYHADNPQRAIDQSALMVVYWGSNDFRDHVAEAQKERYTANPEIAQNHSDYMTQRWEDPDFRKAMSRERSERYSDPKNRLFMSVSCQASKHVRSSSRYRGVTQHGSGWQARIKVSKKTIRLGTHGTPEDAAKAYDEAARKYYGPDAFQNFPTD
jgi:group I intron endonuclease